MIKNEFNIKNPKNLLKFSPSTKITTKILINLLNTNFIERTSLTQKANVNYSELIKHLEWMNKKQIIKIVLENSKIKIALTPEGKEYAKLLADLYDF